MAPFVTRRTKTAMVSSVDNLATAAGVHMLRMGGNAVDAAVAANAVLTVTLPNQCGLGGDLFAIVHREGAAPVVLNASGRSGSGADPVALRDEGHRHMPAVRDVRTSTVPGCVDGWVALHERFGQLEFGEVLRPAIGYAVDGFPASPYLARALGRLSGVDVDGEFGAAGPIRPGSILRRPAIGRMLSGLAKQGRRSFYQGEFGAALVALGQGYFGEHDLAEQHADWVTPLVVRLWGRDVWTAPPNSQGYLTLSAGWLAERLDLPLDPRDPLWPHLLVEAMRQGAFDRGDVLSEGADGPALLAEDRLAPRLAAISRSRTAELPDQYGAGGTTYLCAVDGEHTAVSLIQSNAMSFGSQLLVGDTGVFLQNRGIGFSLADGGVAEFGPRRRPPHTLAPALVTRADGSLEAVLGTRGGDSQPQILLQLLTRLLMLGQDPATAVAAGRWMLRGRGDDTSFNTWGARGAVRIALEGHVPPGWADGLTQKGHATEQEGPFDHAFGHAQVIVAEDARLLGAADPRSLAGSADGF